ncbi:MAG: MaoC/PaaZ C-terminal domain-containing protein [Nitratireductor sp.]
MNVDKVLNYHFEDMQPAYTERDVMLYALGVNAALDPLNEAELRYVFEDGLVALPSYAMVLGHPGFWLRDPELEIDWVKILHAEQFLTMARPLPPRGQVAASYRVTGITDKGPEKGCILYYEKTLREIEGGAEIGRVTSGVFCRGDGGTGNHGSVPEALQPLPPTEPDMSVTRKADPRSALIYRLSGDYNPIHASPPVAAKAGYDRPILHGLCTMGIAGQLLFEEMAGGEPARFGGFACRFSRPVFPGDTLRTDIWKTGDGARFRVTVEDRNEVVLDRGQASLVG